jgi:PadR family transcriptional regulator, regulatory protein PadR
MTSSLILSHPLTFDRTMRKPIVEHREEPCRTRLICYRGRWILVLRTLAAGPMHGWGVAQSIQKVSKDVLQVGQGSLYPALHRLEYKGWIRDDWGTSENNRRAKYYALTVRGRKRLEAELKTWERLSMAIALVLSPEATA